MTPEINTIRKSVALDDETEAIVEAYNQNMKFNNFSLALRQIIHQWDATQHKPAPVFELPAGVLYPPSIRNP